MFEVFWNRHGGLRDALEDGKRLQRIKNTRLALLMSEDDYRSSP